MSNPTLPSQAILVLDDDEDVACAARLLLRRHFSVVTELHSPQRLLAEIDRQRPALLLLDMNFQAGRVDGAEGLAILRALNERQERPKVIVLTAYAAVPVAVEALKLGAIDFVTKPWDNAKLLAAVRAALGQRVTQPTDAATALLGESEGMKMLRRMIATVAPTDANILILGENGVGKELVARALHEASHRVLQRMVTVDMGALHDTTFSSELFGHKKGSFTDANADRIGRFRTAHGGTLFLDEIGNLPPGSQAKLLTALERREVTPIGANAPEPIDVRVISATNLDERLLVDPGRFRPDLLYRLNTIVLRVAPLRDRREDIPLLADHYLEHYARRYAKPVRQLSAAAREALTADDWPGNVRALRNTCERAAIVAGGALYTPEDFAMPTAPAAPRPPPVDAAENSANLSQRERDAIASAMQRAEGNVSQAAKLLGISRAALYRRLGKHGF